MSSVVTANTVKVYDRVFPLRMGAPPGAGSSSSFDGFVEQCFHPIQVALKQQVQGEPSEVQPSYNLVSPVVRTLSQWLRTSSQSR